MLLAAENSLLAGKLDFVRLPLLSWPTIWMQISVGVLMLGFSIYCGKSFEKIFRGALLGVMGWILLFAALLAYRGTQSSTELLESLYVTIKAFRFDFFSFLIWGFLLRLTPAHAAKKYFIPLAVLISLSGEWIRLDYLFAKALRVTIPNLLLLSVGCMAAALLVFNASWKKLSQDPIPSEEPEPTKVLRFPFLSCALLLVGCTVIKRIFDLLWKSEIRSQMSTPEAAQKYPIFSYTGPTTVAFSLCWVFLGSWLIRRRGWTATATGTAIFIWIATIGLFTLINASWLSKVLSYALFTSAASALFFPLVQMLYLHLPSKNRFSVKIGTELVVFRLLASLPSYAAQVLIVALGSIAAASPWLKQLAIGLALLMVLACKRAGSKYSDSASASAVQNS